MEADDGKRGGHSVDRRDARREALRLVDRDVRKPVVAQEGERFVAVALFHPERVAELDSKPVVGKEFARADDLGLVPPRNREPVWVLEEDRAELPGFAQGLERHPEPRMDLVDDLFRQVLWIDT